MPSLNILLDADSGEVAAKLEGKTVHHVTEPFIVAGLAGGMTSGKPSVSLVIPLPDGSVVFCETSLALFLSAGRALAARHGDPTA